MKNIYFIGVGGIGMSSIARFYNHEGYNVAGYDRVESPLTLALESEGIAVNYNENIEAIPAEFLDKNECLVIYTPAIPKNHKQLCYFQDAGFEAVKRSKALGVLSRGKRLVAVAGTHGKSSISTMVAWFLSKAMLLNDGSVGGSSAFLGAISKNIGSNLLLGSGDTLTVEADEFDRSFLQLFPDIAIISSTDADHLDIYGDHNSMKSTFAEFASQIKDGGSLIYKKGIDLTLPSSKITTYSYSLDDKNSDFYAQNIQLASNYLYSFDIVTPEGIIEGCHLGISALINVENCVAAVAVLFLVGFDRESLLGAIDSFRGVKRRFELHINRVDKVYIDDYAHHPTELRATLNSIRAIYGEKKITAIFQPHLYTRTRDFAEGFSASLSLADRVILLPIYPAREEPIEGVNSQMLLEGITSQCEIVEKEELIATIKEDKNEILVSFGAGDIDRFCDEIVKTLSYE
ncbi:MAG: cyanophycin synthetase [Rikenellaceae bacterium]